MKIPCILMKQIQLTGTGGYKHGGQLDHDVTGCKSLPASYLQYNLSFSMPGLADPVPFFDIG